MRRLILICFASLLAFSCRKTATPVPSDVVVRVSVETSSAKAAVGDESSGAFPILWQQGDQISLNGVLSAPMSSTMAGDSEAAFAFSGVSSSSTYNLLYPGAASNTVSLDGKTIPMYASGSSLDEVFVFHHLACGVRLQLVGDFSVSSLSVSAPGGEKIAGVFSVSGGNLTPSDALSSLTVEYPAPVGLSRLNPTYFYLFFAPGTFSDGLLLSATEPTEGITRSWKISTGGTLVKGKMYSIPETAFASAELSDGIIISLEQMTEEPITIEL